MNGLCLALGILFSTMTVCSTIRDISRDLWDKRETLLKDQNSLQHGVEISKALIEKGEYRLAGCALKGELYWCIKMQDTVK